MKPTRKILLGIAALIGLAAIGTLCFHPLVLRVSKYSEPETSTGENPINPLAKFNFSEGKWKVYLLLESNDFSALPVGIPHYTCLTTSDVKVLEQMKAAWELTMQDGDVATVTSSILIFNEDKLVFESGIVLRDGRSGLQSSKYGWATPSDVQKFIAPFKNFHEAHWPVILL